MQNFNDLWITLQQNVYPAMLDQLADDLGVTVDSIKTLGVGFYPLKQAWVFAERDETGQIIGLVKRYKIRGKIKKHCWPGSKRGLHYECLGIRKEKRYQKRKNFVRIHDAGVSCPICGRDDWCMVSDDNIHDPTAVICGPTSEGAERHIKGSGYLHIRKKTNNSSRLANSILPGSDKPCLVVEGPSDVLVALEMGYVAVGKPSAESGNDMLAKLLKGKKVIVLGENDTAGKRGLETTFRALKTVCKSIVKILPPAKFNDLRDWCPTALEFEQHVQEFGVEDKDSQLFETTDDYALAKQWLQETHIKNGQRLLHYYHENWFEYNNQHYELLDKHQLNKELYQYFGSREIIIDNGKHTNICLMKTDRRKLGDIKQALQAECFIKPIPGIYEPFNIVRRERLGTNFLIAFKNGLLDVVTGNFQLLSPDIFMTSVLPYDYNPNYKCPLWLWFVNNIFNCDEECIALLQEWFGYNLVASNHLEQFMFFLGPPASGKSTTADILQAVQSETRYCALNTHSFASSFGLQSAMGKYSAIISEDRATRRRESNKILDKIKQITGQDTLPIDRKFKDVVHTKLFCRITYLSNELLPFDDSSQALLRRLNLLYFPNSYVDKPDRTLKQRLTVEAPGITVWAVEGLKQLLKQGDFTKPEASKEHIIQFKQTTNPLLAMVNEWCQLYSGFEATNNFTPIEHLFELYKVWCKENNISSPNRISFGRKLHNALPNLKSKRVMEQGCRINIYQGITILPEIFRQYLGGL